MMQRTQSLDANLSASVCPPETAYGTFSMTDPGQDLSGTLQGAGGVGGLLIASINGTNCFPCFDGNGNVMGLVNSADGTVVAEYEYSPVGVTLKASGPLAKANPFRFSTKPTDDENGVVPFPLRDYSPDLQRWLSRDALGERGGANLYVYVRNNAVNNTDYLGRESNDQKVSPEDQAKKEAEVNKSKMAKDLYARMVALCPSSAVILPSNTGAAPGYGPQSGWAHAQCCTPESCKKQAKALSDAMADFASKVALAEEMKHGSVVGGWEGNLIRLARNPGADTGMEGNGLACSDWQRHMNDTYDTTLGKSYGEAGTLCFRGAAVHLHEKYFWLWEGNPYHHWFVLFGPNTLSSGSGGVTIINVGNPDITIDPWISGGLELVPASPYYATGIDALTKW
jgi:RHS repeat-associated protein